jgi:hypothetical protein
LVLCSADPLVLRRLGLQAFPGERDELYINQSSFCF